MWKKMKAKAAASAAKAQEKTKAVAAKTSENKYGASLVKGTAAMGKSIQKSVVSVADKVSTYGSEAVEKDFLSSQEVHKIKFKLEDIAKANPMTAENAKSEYILLMALRALKKNFVERFLKLCRKFEKEINVNQMVKENDEAPIEVFWVTCIKTYQDVRVWRFLVMRYAKIMKSAEGTPLELALLYGTDDHVRTCIELGGQGGQNAEVHDHVDKWAFTQHAMYLFIKYMNETNSPENVEIAMSVFQKTLLKLIKEKRSFPQDFWSLLFIYQRDFTGSKSLWSQTLLKTKNVLDISKLHKYPTDWYWFKSNILDNPVWIDSVGHVSKGDGVAAASDEKKEDGKEAEAEEIRFDELLSHAKDEMAKECHHLELSLKKELEKNEEVWQNLVNFSYISDEYKEESMWRQDTHKHGVKADVKLANLEDITIRSSGNFDAQANSDYGSYLSKLITRAHIINQPFQDYMKSIFKEKHSAGPVKDIVRCRAKAQMDYADEAFPTSARIIDLIRCAIEFDDIEDFHQGMEKFMKRLSEDKDDHSQKGFLARRLANRYGRIKMEVMRLKNGFNGMTKGVDYNLSTSRLDLPVPNNYCDIKANVIVQIWDSRTKQKMSIVGEVQFLLKTMIHTKHLIHRFYSVIRTDEFIRACAKEVKSATFSNRMQEAGSASKRLAPLLVDYPLYLNEKFFESSDELKNNMVMRMAKNKMHVSLLEIVLNASPKSVWETVNTNGFTLLHFVCMYQTKQESYQLFLAHLNKNGDDSWVAEKWQNRTKRLNLTPWGMVLKHRDFTEQPWLLESVPSSLRGDKAYVYGVTTRGKETSTHLVAANPNRHCRERLKFIENGLGNSDFQASLLAIESMNRYNPLMHAIGEGQIVTSDILDILSPKSCDESFWMAQDLDGDHIVNLLMKFGKDDVDMPLSSQLRTVANRVGPKTYLKLLKTGNDNQFIPLMCAISRQSLSDELLKELLPDELRSDEAFWDMTSLENENNLHLLIKYKQADADLIQQMDTLLKFVPHDLVVKMMKSRTKDGKVPRQYLGGVEQTFKRMSDGIHKLFDHYLKGKKKPEIAEYQVESEAAAGEE